MDLYENFAACCTIHWWKSFVSTLSCLLCHFATNFLERSAERALNLGINGACWDMFGSLRSSASCGSGFNRLQIFTIAPIVRIELEAIQAIGIVPIILVVSVVSVVFPHDCPDRLVLFWDDWDDRDDPDDHMETRLERERPPRENTAIV